MVALESDSLNGTQGTQPWIFLSRLWTLPDFHLLDSAHTHIKGIVCLLGPLLASPGAVNAPIAAALNELLLMDDVGHKKRVSIESQLTPV